MKFILVSPKNRTVYNFRGELIKKIIACGYEVVVTGPDRTDVDKITALGAKFVEVPINKNGMNPIKDLGYQKRLTELFVQEKPDVVLGYTSKPVVYGMVAAKKAAKKLKKPIRAVAMITGLGYAFTAKTFKAKIVRFILSLLYRRALKRADAVIFQNEDDKVLFERLCLVRAKKTGLVNGSGVDTCRFAIAEYPERLTFFMLARVMYSKGIREYLKACQIVKKQHPEVRCMLLGACEGIQDSLPKEFLQPYIDGGVIEHFGETDCVEQYYKQCSVYVLPSYREGTPRTVLEAMSMGRAVITTDTPGCRSTVKDGENGFLVPIKDEKTLADAMLKFIDEPSLVQTMGEASAQYCREKFDVDKVNLVMCEYLNIK